MSDKEQPRLTIRHVPIIDTGIGREAGFDSDQALIEAAEAQRAALSPDTRAALEAADREFEHRILFGN